MQIRTYQSSDCKEITELFYNTIHTVNRRDYTKEQKKETGIRGEMLHMLIFYQI